MLLQEIANVTYVSAQNLPVALPQHPQTHWPRSRSLLFPLWWTGPIYLGFNK